MNEIALSIVLHDHQPVGNFDWVIEEAYQRAYMPMLRCLQRHPSIKLTLHITGPLRDWLRMNEPKFIPAVRELVERGQLEVLSGGYYEPILVSLTQIDQLGQVKKLNEAVEADYGIRPKGAWLAERVWEPHLPCLFGEAGLEYVILDDTHFKAAGLTDEEMFGYYLTEDQGAPLKVFPTVKHLRYAIPWAEVDDVIDWLRDKANDPGGKGLYLGRRKLAVVGDDGEKFGLWATTYNRVWEDGWMDTFFTAIKANDDWLHTVTPSEFIAENPALGRVYLPTNSYDEMGEWSMPPDPAYELPHLKRAFTKEGRTDITQYMRGGLWRNFMVKYDEVNQLHKKALLVSRKVHAMPEGPDKDRALDHLWAGQCNCGYWHGSFGGIYLFHIREINYRNLITAEELADEAAGEKGIRFIETDFDLDGSDDLVIESPGQNLIFDLDKGGSLVEWDYRKAKYNLANVMTRRREAYHRDLEEALAEGRVYMTDDIEALDQLERERAVLVSEYGLEGHLIYDWHRRGLFIDHFLREGTTSEDYASARYGEQGDFANQPYHAQVKSDEAILTRVGSVWASDQQLPVKVEKRFSLHHDFEQMHVDYTVTNFSEKLLNPDFGIEMSWGFAGGQSVEMAAYQINGEYFSLGKVNTHERIRSYSLNSPLWGINIRLNFSQQADLWVFPLETISNSGTYFERTYQGSSMLLRWPLAVKPGQSWKVAFEIGLSRF